MLPTATVSLTSKGSLKLSIQNHSLKSILNGNFHISLLFGIMYEKFVYNAVCSLTGFWISVDSKNPAALSLLDSHSSII